MFRFTRLQRNRRGLPEEAFDPVRSENKLRFIVVPSRKAVNRAIEWLFKHG